MLNLINKQDFVEAVRASMSLDVIRTAQLAPLDTNERFNLVILSVKNWSNQMRLQAHNNLYAYFHYVAEWINIAHASPEFSKEETERLNMRGIDPLLELIWECVQEARTDLSEVLAFLHDRLVDRPL